MRPAEAALLPTPALERELAPFITPESAKLTERQPDEPDRADLELLCSGSAPYFVVRVPIPGRSGKIWVSRLPGIHPRFARRELLALEEHGVTRIVCLVPTVSLEELHGANAYLGLARERFGERFHQIEIVDQKVPRDDELFERVVDLVDGALEGGEQVLVHCVGGCGRSGTFVSCLLTRAGLEPADAIRTFRRQRRCGPETGQQVAYVYRYASRRRPPSTSTKPLVRLTGDEPLARGGLAAIHTGRLALPGGGSRRVAVKLFRYPVDGELAAERQRCIERLVEAGVRLPRMFMHELDSRWVQVTPLFGSRSRGSKLSQPSRFYERMGESERRFAVEQLVRVAEAGYRPSMDLFVIFDDGTHRVVPIDLDLITEQPSLSIRAQELVKLIIKLGETAEGRDELLKHARETSGLESDLGRKLHELVRSEGSPYRALWRMG